MATWSRDYIGGLTGTRYVGAPDSAEAHAGANRWIGLFSAACRRAVEDAGRFELQVRALQSSWRERVGHTRRDSAVHLLIDALSGAPMLTASTAAKLMGRSFQTASQRRTCEDPIIDSVLTRLQVEGFKNLDRIDVRLGPFTCVAGPNGVGKSNLFDAISFLAALAGKPLVEAASTVRGGDSRRGDVWSLFRRAGDHVTDTMRFAAEFLIPEDGEDELGQVAKASMTFLQYELELRYRQDSAVRTMGALEIVRERMVHINRSKAKSRLGFPHKKSWRDSVVKGRRTSPYISTENEGDGEPVVSLHADSVAGLGGGRPRRVPAANLPRTMLSSVNNAAEHRTLVLARQEMAGWTQLQLEPSALRAPDGFTAPRSMGPSGAHLAATLYDLAQAAQRDHPGGERDVYARVANRLSELVENVRGIAVDVDDKRQLLSIVMTDLQNTEHVASALSDGTLRFLALTVMESDPKSRRLLCLEEPENGMHPLRISAVIELLGELAVDVEEPVDAENPLRQVIINTHSPSVVGCVHDNALLVAHAGRGSESEASRLSIRHLPHTWRDQEDADEPTVTRGDLLAYLNPLQTIDDGDDAPRAGARRVMHRADLRQPGLPLAPTDTGPAR